ncbi:FixH family protein [Sporosarcina sp. FSL K6-1522]|uniref:FixH family protein n=1 Tax=Sporosarcina sp. FSL K6-1522 TaxID=2921554 RepID=UPI00315A596E
MKNIQRLLVMAVVLVLAACGKEAPPTTTDAVPLPLTVDLTVTEQVEVNDTVEMAAVVTQGDEKVEDAQTVEFEVWEEGKKDASVIIESVNEKNGLYTATTTFDRDGLFHVQVHVTARDMHTMPKKEVTVGTGMTSEEGHVSEDEHAHGQTDGFTMHFANPERVKIDAATELVVHLQLDNKPLEKARVRYEIWQEANPDQREWAEAKEVAAGEYTVTHTFAEEGALTIQIHVEDDNDLHEHEAYQIVVEK